MRKLLSLICVLAMASIGAVAQETTWTVAGVSTLCGSAWDPSDTNNDMVSRDGKIYTWTKTDVTLEAGKNYDLKIVKNHSWDEAYGGFAGGQASDNYVIRVEETGAYTVEVVFDSEAIVITHSVTKTGEAVILSTWTVAGVSALCGSAWDPSDTSNDMVTRDGKIYTWTKENVALEANVSYELKVVRDHDWSECYGSVEYGNYQIYVEEDGSYKVVVTFDSETKLISHEATKTGEATFAEKTWTIAGVSDLMGSAWDPTDTNNDMTKVDEGVYYLKKNNVALLADVYYEYKVCANHAWDECYGLDGGYSNAVLWVEKDGDYDVEFIFYVETKSLEAYATLNGTSPEQTDNMLYIPEGTTLSKGESIALPISMKNSKDIVACQFDAVLPEGITFQGVSLNRNRCYSHSISYNTLADGSIGFVIVSTDNEVFAGNDGELLYLIVNTSELAGGNYGITLKNVQLTTKSYETLTPQDATFSVNVPDYLMGDLNRDLAIDGIDVSWLIWYILYDYYDSLGDLFPVNNPDGRLNGMDLVEEVDLVLSQDYTGMIMQKRAAAAEAVTLTGNNGNYQLGIASNQSFVLAQMIVEVAEGTTLTSVASDSRHVAAFRELAPNKYSVLCYSNSNMPFNDNNSMLTFNCTGDMTITDVLLVDSNREGYWFNVVTSGDATGIRSIENSPSTIGNYYNLNGQKVQNPAKGVFINNGRKVVVK